MKGWKKGLAFVLAAIVFVSGTWMNGNAEENAIERSTVIYNLGQEEIFVGYDVQQATEHPEKYKLFDEQGNYTIELEKDAFFPYEIQFQVDGVTRVETFETPESRIQVGGHEFTVHSEMVSEDHLNRIGFWIGEQYVPARPEPKIFTNEPRRGSLLPLRQVLLNADIQAFNVFQLQHVRASAVLQGESLKETDRIAWRSSLAEDSFHTEQEMDLREIRSLEMIVGSAKPLDENNVRYIIHLKKKEDFYGAIRGEYLSKEVGGVRTRITPLDTKGIIDYGKGYLDRRTYYLKSRDMDADAYYIENFVVNPSYVDTLGAISVYEGHFETISELEDAIATGRVNDVTSRLVADAGISLPMNAGVRLDEDENGQYRKELTLLMHGTHKYLNHWTIRVLPSEDYFLKFLRSAYLIPEGSNEQMKTEKIVLQDDIWVLKMDAKSTVPIYKMLFDADKDDQSKKKIKKIAVGHFDSWAGASTARDIKDLSLKDEEREESQQGYREDFSGDGRDFTIFFDEEPCKIRVQIEDEIESNLPDEEETGKYAPGSSDTYFSVNGAKELTRVYKLPYKHDTYYDMGYQTIFYLDEVAPNRLTPTFWNGNNVTVYAGESGSSGLKQISGESVVDFSKGAVHYAAAAEDGKNLKNYWITYVPKQKGGAKLFVNGINGPDGAKREVFLTSKYDHLHDVLVVNVGDQALTGLKAELIGAQNVKLDSYWTIGGANNNRLEAFDDVTTTEERIQPKNVAKVRLVPNGEGPISGELILSADGQEPVKITISGTAGDLKLLTEQIPKAVKWVPYRAQILHNNKYEWNQTEIRLVEGSLPKGVHLNPNGEIYGVPNEVGKFEFSLEMKNSDERFGNPIKKYVLVVQDNTNENVDQATDRGYEVIKRIGKVIGSEDVVVDFSDQLFISNGKFSEFTALWLNGEKLIENLHYMKEEGSTKITVLGQTLKDKGNHNGVNTIAAEFRVDGDKNKELKRSAQNFRMDVKKPNVQPGNKPNNDPSGGGSSRNRDRDSESGAMRPSVPAGPKISSSLPPVLNPNAKTVRTVEIPFVLSDGKATLGAPNKELNEIIQRIQKEFAKDLVILKFKANKPLDSKAEIDISIAAAFVKELAVFENLSLRIEVEQWGNWTLGPEALDEMARRVQENMIMSWKKDKNEQYMQCKVDGMKIDEMPSGIKVQIPVDAGSTPTLTFSSKNQIRSLRKSVVKNGVAYAKIPGSGTLRMTPYEKSFQDIPVTHPFAEQIQFTASRELFSGISPTQFGPNLTMDRAMFVTVLHKLEGNPNAGEGKTFRDVSEGAWYRSGVSWASKVGLVAGYDDGRFGVFDPINREQLSMMMYRYADYIGMDNKARVDMKYFTDADQVSPWAKDSMSWATATGLFRTSEGLSPKAAVTRAEMAAVLMNFVRQWAE